MAEWQTHQLEGLAGAIPWRFESSFPHQLKFQQIDAARAGVTAWGYNRHTEGLMPGDSKYDRYLWRARFGLSALVAAALLYRALFKH